jgi:hypothetical protein
MRFGSVILMLLLVGCSGSSIVMDRSADAFSAGDMTLVSSCQAAPGPKLGMASGVDSCRFTVNDTVAGNWILVVPPPKGQVTGGTVDVYYRDLHKSYPVKDWIVPISFSDFLGITKWTSAFDEAVLEALVTINWNDNENVQQISRYRGIAVLIVTATGYERMPIDSGNSAWGTKCKVQYSPAGRSALQCSQ